MLNLKELAEQSAEIKTAIKLIEKNYAISKTEGDSYETTKLLKQCLLALYKTDNAVSQRIHRRKQLSLEFSPNPEA